MEYFLHPAPIIIIDTTGIRNVFMCYNLKPASYGVNPEQSLEDNTLEGKLKIPVAINSRSFPNGIIIFPNGSSAVQKKNIYGLFTATGIYIIIKGIFEPLNGARLFRQC